MLEGRVRCPACKKHCFSSCQSFSKLLLGDSLGWWQWCWTHQWNCSTM